jgi:uroporphyrinogen-III synthase
MADRLNGYRILILETREEAQFSRLLTEQGADVLQCPMFTIHDAPDATPIAAWIRRFVERP